jgi:hypothetical protein
VFSSHQSNLDPKAYQRVVRAHSSDAQEWAMCLSIITGLVVDRIGLNTSCRSQCKTIPLTQLYHVHVKSHPKTSKAVHIRICDDLKRQGGNLQNCIRALISHQICYTRLYKPAICTLEPSFVALCAREHSTTTFLFLSLPGINKHKVRTYTTPRNTCSKGCRSMWRSMYRDHCSGTRFTGPLFIPVFRTTVRTKGTGVGGPTTFTRSSESGRGVGGPTTFTRSSESGRGAGAIDRVHFIAPYISDITHMD